MRAFRHCSIHLELHQIAGQLRGDDDGFFDALVDEICVDGRGALRFFAEELADGDVFEAEISSEPGALRSLAYARTTWVKSLRS